MTTYFGINRLPPRQPVATSTCNYCRCCTNMSAEELLLPLKWAWNVITGMNHTAYGRYVLSERIPDAYLKTVSSVTPLCIKIWEKLSECNAALVNLLPLGASRAPCSHNNAQRRTLWSFYLASTFPSLVRSFFFFLINIYCIVSLVYTNQRKFSDGEAQKSYLVHSSLRFHTGPTDHPAPDTQTQRRQERTLSVHVGNEKEI